jgi:ankyrin repeat protein
MSDSDSDEYTHLSDSDSDDSDDADPRHEQLYRAIYVGDDAAALSIVRGGVDVNGGWNGWTHLLFASSYNRVAVVSCLLELGADADKTKPGFLFPLGFAAGNGHQEVVELLVEVGNAQLDKLRDCDGWSALHCAARNGKLVPAKYLVARGCSLTVQTIHGRIPLDFATQRNHPHLIQFLTSASLLTAANDYFSLRTLCAPVSSPYLSGNIARQLRYTTILTARHARRIHDDPSLHTPLLPFLLRLALLPSADNRSPNTESQVFRRVLTYVGTGFDVDVADVVSSRTRSRSSKGVNVGAKRGRSSS